MTPTEHSNAPLAHGVCLQTRADSPLDRQAEELRSVGYTLVDSGFSESRLAVLRTSLEAVYRRQLDECGGTAALARSNDLDVARCPLVYDDAFVGVAAHPALRALFARLLGDNMVLLQQNGLFNRPADVHYQARWHRDMSYQHWTSSEPLALNALLTLDEFTLDNGATHVLPGSHLRAEFPSPAHALKFEQPLTAPAGTYLVMDAMLFHRAGYNRSQGERRAVNHLIGRPFMAQQFDLAHLLEGRHSADPFLSRYLGYRWSPSRSVVEWRRGRMAA